MTQSADGENHCANKQYGKIRHVPTSAACMVTWIFAGSAVEQIKHSTPNLTTRASRYEIQHYRPIIEIIQAWSCLPKDSSEAINRLGFGSGRVLGRYRLKMATVGSLNYDSVSQRTEVVWRMKNRGVAEADGD